MAITLGDDQGETECRELLRQLGILEQQIAQARQSLSSRYSQFFPDTDNQRVWTRWERSQSCNRILENAEASIQLIRDKINSDLADIDVVLPRL